MALPNIFVVDDDRFFRTLVRALLGSFQANVVEFRSADEALAALAAKPALVITDMHMPGEPAAKLIGAAQKVGIPVFVLTGQALSPEDVARLGNPMVITKATVRESLRARVAELLKPSA